MKSKKSYTVMDPLYGEVRFCKEIEPLLWLTPLQRLRHIRLSNIDSIDMPGISNISRYEHAIGVGYLSKQVGFFKKLSHKDSLILQAAALLHDWNITPYGHLVEEAFSYVSQGYNHETKMEDMQRNEFSELGGLNCQLIYGRETKIKQWVLSIFGSDWEESLLTIGAIIKGEGKLGKCIASNIDLDNIDNVLRIAFHMGLKVDRSLPKKVAQGMEDICDKSGVIYSPSIIPYIREWLELRKIVYSKLMPSKVDFSGKTMLIWAIVWGLSQGIIKRYDWSLDDINLTMKLLTCGNEKIVETVKRWLVGEVWNLSELFWLEGKMPIYQKIFDFCKVVSKEIGRECLVYRIKDKRDRKLTIITSDGNYVTGNNSNKWLLGVASPLRKNFSKKENKIIINLASDYFEAAYIGTSDEEQNKLSVLFSP